MTLPPLPSSWSALSWQQLCDLWTAKLRYGGNADVARCAALLSLVQGSRFKVQGYGTDEHTGEQLYLLRPETLNLEPETSGACTVTARELAWLSRKALPWFDFPYGDQGEPEEKDETGKVTKEGRDPVFGYVNPDWRDAMALPEQEVVVVGRTIVPGSKFKVQGAARADLPLELVRLPEQESDRNEYKDLKSAIKRIANALTHSGGIANPAEREALETCNLKLETKGEPPIHFALPERACTNVTWHQYRSLQALTQMLFQDGITDDAATELQAQFLAYILLPEQPAQTGTDRFARRHKFAYDADRAEQTVPFWRSLLTGPDAPAAVLYALCFQTYHTALRYYEKVFPLLYQSSGKADPLHDALTGEVDTINCVMKYQGYSSPEQVYNTELPIVLSVLNTITKEAKEIEKIKSQSHRGRK